MVDIFHGQTLSKISSHAFVKFDAAYTKLLRNYILRPTWFLFWVQSFFPGMCCENCQEDHRKTCNLLDNEKWM